MSMTPVTTNASTASSSSNEYACPTLIHYGPLSELTQGGRGSQNEGGSSLRTKFP